MSKRRFWWCLFVCSQWLLDLGSRAVAQIPESAAPAAPTAGVTAVDTEGTPGSQSEPPRPSEVTALPSSLADTSPLDPAETSGQQEVEAEYPRFQVGARLIAGADWNTTHPTAEQNERDSRQPFFLKQARVKLRADLTDRIYLNFSADLEGEPPVRSAFMDVKFKRYLRVRVGRFKRPISRIELTSVGHLPFPDRGLFNAALIEGAGWGDRALGMMVHGKLKRPKLRYYAAVTNAAPTVDVNLFERLRGVDVLGRLEYRPIAPLTLAINGGHKTREARVSGPNLQLLAFGGDVRLRVGALEAVVEALAAENPYPPAPPQLADRRPWAFVALGYATYDWRLTSEAVLQPVVAGEWVDTDLDLAEDEALRVLIGVNLLWLSRLRIMPRIELVRPLGQVGARSYVSSETYALVLSLAI